MKKIIAFMLCCVMMVGALSAFAEDAVMPCWDCDHKNSTHTETTTVRVRTCYYKDVHKEICDDCGRTVDSYADYYTSHEGPIREENGVDICKACGDEA